MIEPLMVGSLMIEPLYERTSRDLVSVEVQELTVRGLGVNGLVLF